MYAHRKAAFLDLVEILRFCCILVRLGRNAQKFEFFYSREPLYRTLRQYNKYFLKGDVSPSPQSQWKSWRHSFYWVFIDFHQFVKSQFTRSIANGWSTHLHEMINLPAGLWNTYDDVFQLSTSLHQIKKKKSLFIREATEHSCMVLKIVFEALFVGESKNHDQNNRLAAARLDDLTRRFRYFPGLACTDK